MRPLLLALLFGGAPEVALPPKTDVAPPIAQRDVAEGVRAGVRAARPRLDACWQRDAGWDCACEALKQVRFDVWLDGGMLTVTYPLRGHAGPSFTLDANGRVVDCR